MNVVIAVTFGLAAAAIIACIVLCCFLASAFTEISELRQELRIFKLSTIFRG